MKLHRILPALALLVASAGMVSCDNDFEYPPVIVPTATMEPNTTIAELKQLYWNAGSGEKWSVEIGKRSDGQDIIIAGTIISSDETGNIFKFLMVRDDDGEAVTFAINKGTLDDELYVGHKYGQRIVVDVTGMSIGMASNQFEIGIPSTDYGISYIDRAVFDEKSQVDGLPGKVSPVATDLTTVNGAIRNNEGRQKWQSQLIQLDNVQFVDGGAATFGDNGSWGNRYITDEQGQRINVRCSGKSSFAYTTLPTGRGTLVGILQQYREEWQILLNDINTETSLIGFDWSAGSTEAIFKAGFAGGNMENFTIDNVTLPEGLASVWEASTKYNCIVATGYDKGTSSNFETDSWLVSPVIDLAGVETPYMAFDQALNYFSSLEVAKTQATVAVREEGQTAWTTLTIPTYPTAMGFDFVNTGDINLSQWAGKKIQIGFHYISTTAKAGTWEFKNLVVKPTGTDTPVVPGPEQPDQPTGSELLKSTFAAGQDDWTIDNVTMDGIEYVWAHDERYACMKASAYVGGASHASDSYLISPVVDLAGASNATLTFEHALNKFNSLDMAKSQCTLVIREEGQTAWTVLSIPDYGDAASWTFLPAGEVSLAAYAGKKVQIAFHYTSTAEASGTWEVKNVLIKK